MSKVKIMSLTLDIKLQTCFLSVVADCFHRARGHRFITQRAFFFRFRLLENEGVTVLVRACKIVRRCIPAHVAVYAGRVNIIRAGNILLDAIIRISQSCPLIQG
jgi:hypothetical protein